MIKLYNCDCLELMAELSDDSVDMVCCDLPYGITRNSWDRIIDMDALWSQYRRIVKEKGVIVLTAAQPFTTKLIASNPKMFKQALVWEKNIASGFLNANKMHMPIHEDLLVFYRKFSVFNRQHRAGKPYTRKYNGRGLSQKNYGVVKKRPDRVDVATRCPVSVLKFPVEKGLHPTQKPVALFEYLIRTYSNEGDTVLDNCMGSGTTGVACLNAGRSFIGMELDPDYFNVACKRIYGESGEVE